MPDPFYIDPRETYQGFPANFDKDALTRFRPTFTCLVKIPEFMDDMSVLSLDHEMHFYAAAGRLFDDNDEPTSPHFIAVCIDREDIGKFSEVHREIIKLVQKHYTLEDLPNHPGLTKPVLR